MDDASTALLHKVLRDNGYSITAVRQAVCDLLWGRGPQSMRELTVRSQGQLDRASLYRTLALFEKLGLIQRVYIGWKYKIELSDVLTHHHHHISCTRCGKIVALTHEDEVEQLLSRLAARHGFTATTHQLEIQGQCAVCTTSNTSG